MAQLTFRGILQDRTHVVLDEAAPLPDGTPVEVTPLILERKEVSRWQYLILRPHRWRRQLSIKGRNMTVGQLVSTIHANHLTPEQASENTELPVEAIMEALAYYAEEEQLIRLEAAEERRYLKEKGYPLEPKDLPR